MLLPFQNEQFFKVRLLLFFPFLFFIVPIYAQTLLISNDRHTYDSNYYDKLPDHLTAKLLSFTKFSDFNITDGLLNQTLSYNAHPGPSWGLGMNYKWLGLNLSTGYDPPKDTIYEKSRRFDFQTHIFLRKLTLQFYSSVYSGYYLKQPAKFLNNWPQQLNYSRSDIKTKTFGVSGFYIFNSGRFSNKASTVQNEWQKKSAGSLLAGGTLLYNQVKADSAIIPATIIMTNFFRDTNFTYSQQLTLGGQVGYAFTMVISQHWFVNFSILGGFSLGRTKLDIVEGGILSENRLNFILINSAGFGYNSQRFYAGFNYTNLVSTSPTPVENTSID